MNALIGVLSVVFTAVVTLVPLSASAERLDPDCTVEKAARRAAMKTTVGVGGRCTPAETAKDVAAEAVGIEQKGPVGQRRDNDHKAVRRAAGAIRD